MSNGGTVSTGRPGRIPTRTACVGGRVPLPVRAQMKTLLTWGFFLGFAALMAAGVALAVNGKGMAVMLVSFLVYLGLFIKLGCLPSSH